ncbi:hypothetical protein CEXT_272431, partial [Caerostris extrusa]
AWFPQKFSVVKHSLGWFDSKERFPVVKIPIRISEVKSRFLSKIFERICGNYADESRMVSTLMTGGFDLNDLLQQLNPIRLEAILNKSLMTEAPGKANTVTHLKVHMRDEIRHVNAPPQKNEKRSTVLCLSLRPHSHGVRKASPTQPIALMSSREHSDFPARAERRSPRADVHFIMWGRAAL